MARTRRATCNCCGESVRKGNCVNENCNSFTFYEAGTRQALRHRALAAMPGTISEISIRACVSRSTAQAWVFTMFNANECHVAGERVQGGRPAIVYAAGPTRK